MNRYIFLSCCILLLAFAFPQPSPCALPVPKENVSNLIKEVMGRWLGERNKAAEALAKAKTEKVSPENWRRLNEAIKRGIPENATIEDIASREWSAVDDTTRESVYAEAAELEARLDKERKEVEEKEREQDEEKKRSEECARKFASVIKQTACLYLKIAIVTGHSPDEQPLADFVTGAGGAGIECAVSPLAHYVAKATNANVEKTITTLVKSIVRATPRPSSHPEPSNETEKTELLLLHLLCGGK